MVAQVILERITVMVITINFSGSKIEEKLSNQVKFLMLHLIFALTLLAPKPTNGQTFFLVHAQKKWTKSGACMKMVKSLTRKVTCAWMLSNTMEQSEGT